MVRIGLHCLFANSGVRSPQLLIQNRGETVSDFGALRKQGGCIGYNRNMTIGINRGFGLGNRNKTIKASLRLHTGPHCKEQYTVFRDCLSNYQPRPKFPLYTLSLYRGLRSLGLLGCPTLYAAHSFLNQEQSCATHGLPLRTSDIWFVRNPHPAPVP